jgi:hypothetical protein
MPRLSKLNSKLLRSAMVAALKAEGETVPDDDLTGEGEDEQLEDEDVPTSRRGRKSKARRSQEQDDTTAEDEDDTTAEDEEAEDEDVPTSRRGRKSSRAGRRSEDTDDTTAEGEDDETAEDEYDESAEDEDDTTAEDEEAEDEDVPTSRRGRKSGQKATGERARIAAVTRSKLAAGREDLADFLAFDTGLSSRMCLSILQNAPKARAASTLRSRMASIDNPRIKAGGRSAANEDVEVRSAIKTAQQFGF